MFNQKQNLEQATITFDVASIKPYIASVTKQSQPTSRGAATLGSSPKQVMEIELNNENPRQGNQSPSQSPAQNPNQDQDQKQGSQSPTEKQPGQSNPSNREG